MDSPLLLNLYLTTEWTERLKTKNLHVHRRGFRGSITQEGFFGTVAPGSLHLCHETGSEGRDILLTLDPTRGPTRDVPNGQMVKRRLVYLLCFRCKKRVSSPLYLEWFTTTVVGGSKV